MSGIEVAAQAKPDVEIRVVQEGTFQGQSRQGRDLAGELKLEIEEPSRVNHGEAEVSGLVSEVGG
jgi:hypothetical protein